MNNTQDQDAQEFAAFVKSGGWRLGLLVARNVRLATPGGKAGTPIITSNNEDVKITGLAWAKKTGVSQTTIVFYLKAWNFAAEEHIVPPSRDIAPGADIEDLPQDKDLWSAYYNRAKKPAKPRLKPVPKPRGKPSTPGSIALSKAQILLDTINEYPEKADSAVALGNQLGWSHQDVGRYLKLAQAPPEIKMLLADDKLKWSVTQEILGAPNLEPIEQIRLANKFVSGALPQIGQGSKKIRPYIVAVQQTYGHLRQQFLTTEMTFEQLTEEHERIEAEHQANKNKKKFDETQMISWASNFNTRVVKHSEQLDLFNQGLVGARPYAEGMRVIDPFTTAQTVKELQRIRTRLQEQLELTAEFITGFGGEVNHPTRPEAEPVIIDMEDGDRVGLYVVPR